MHASSDADAPAFHDLRRRLTRCRLAQLDLRLRVELLLIGLLLTGFVFWQVRAPLASLRLHGGVLTVLAIVSGMWVLLAILTGGTVAVRYARYLQAPPGPTWLALPVSETGLARHLAWEASLPALWVTVPAVGIFAAALGPAPWVALVALLPLWIGLLWLAGRGGAWLARRIVVRGAKPGDLLRHLATATAQSRSSRRRRARWGRRPAWLALALKDLSMTRRIGALARPLATALLFWFLAGAAWRLPTPPHALDLPYVAAFVLSLLGSATLGEWLVAVAGSDPFATVRSLPLGVATVWTARFAWGLLATALLVVIHAVFARGIAPHALHLFLAWSALGTLAIVTLAVNYGVTLFPRADVAQRLLGLSLGLAVAASLMIPLLGWIVLLSAVLHSARRLPRWSRLEEA